MNRLAISIACLALAVPANAQHTLTLRVEGTTSGVVLGPQFACPPTCTPSIERNRSVTLTPRSVSSTFLRWETGVGPANACNETKQACTFTMDGPATLTARFGPGIPLMLSRIGDAGSARNVQNFIDPSFEPLFPVEIQCPPDCQGRFAAGTEVVLKSEPDLGPGVAGLVFRGWSGGTGSATSCVEKSQTCRFTITQASTLSFHFEKRATAPIDVELVGSGRVALVFSPLQGRETLSLERKSCRHLGTLGSSVSVTASPEPNTAFKRWVGGPCDGATRSTCTFTLPGPVSMKVEAAQTDAEKKLVISTLGNAEGRVIATVLTAGVSPVDIDCRRNEKSTAGICGARLPHGTVVKLQAIPTKDRAGQPEPEFKGWFEGTGSASACNGRTETSCQFALSSDSEVKARFCRAVLGCLGQ